MTVLSATELAWYPLYLALAMMPFAVGVAVAELMKFGEEMRTEENK